jgi:hypothetical protein
MGYPNDVKTPNSNFSSESYPGTDNSVRPDISLFSTSRFDKEVLSLTHQFINRVDL